MLPYIEVNGMNKKKYVVMKLHRASHSLYVRKIPLLPRFIFLFTRLICGCSIPPSVVFGEGTRLAHNGLGVVIHDKCIIGRDVVIQANVVLGGQNGLAPQIGDYCYIGAGACIIGGVKIGRDVIVGANAVVTSDVPDASVVVGVPAKIIKSVDPSTIGTMKN
jgi:serine O-acetyltransferase